VGRLVLAAIAAAVVCASSAAPQPFVPAIAITGVLDAPKTTARVRASGAQAIRINLSWDAQKTRPRDFRPAAPGAALHPRRSRR
jgi:hypothetical protein